MMKSIALLIVVTSSQASNYCLICKDHTMCIYEENFGSKCKDVKTYQVDEGSQQLIVDIHNVLRSYVATGKESRGKTASQPPASNMRAL
ncbi:hypothetical protein L9F63_006504, partial [Diploptera punctata]